MQGPQALEMAEFVVLLVEAAHPLVEGHQEGVGRLAVASA